VQERLRADHTEVQLVYPVTTEPVTADVYETLLVDFYDQSAKRIAEVLDAGTDVVVLCEGDPFFYGSFMYLHNRLGDRYATEVVPGVPSALAGAAVLGAPLVCGTEALTVLSGVLPDVELDARLRDAHAVVVMKLGRNLEKVRRAITRAGLLERAHYVERVTMTNERVMPLAAADASTAPYFSMVVVPSASAPLR
jgi:precorrin-2/cobalt-factor-2 C20-methyltransferase